MGYSNEVADSPVGWVAKHIQSYVDSDGTKGHEFHGVEALLLTTRGRRSGQLRRTALYYGSDGDSFVVVASNGGAVRHPLWYLNLTDDPDVTVQVKGDVFAARAHTATPDEKPRLWELMAARFPTYRSYEKKTSRIIPVVVLTPA